VGLALVLPSIATANVITNLSAIPNPFSPNGDGMLDAATIYGQVAVPVDSLRLAVRNDSGTETWSLSVESLGAGSYEWEWDGRTSGGETFSDGVHRLTAVAYVGGSVADSVDRLVSTDLFAPRIVDFHQIRSSFAPDADLWNLAGLRFGIETGGPASDTTRVRILDVSGSPVLNVGGFGGAAGETTFYWDGRDEAALLVVEGSYAFEVRAADEAGNEDVQAGLVYVDLGAPLVGADADTVFAHAFPETLSGWAEDPSGVEAVFLRSSPGDWEELDVTGGESVVWSHVVGDSSDADGWYEVFVKARDVFGHETDSVRVVVGKAGSGPIHVDSRIADGDTVFADGDLVEIESEWDRSGYEIEASFVQLDSNFQEGWETVEDEGDGSYRISYPVSTANARENAVGLPIRIRATHVFRADSAFVWVELRNESAEPESVDRLTLDRNIFNPDLEEDVTIAFPSAEAGATLEIYTVLGERVWWDRVAGLTSVVWNGRNSEGDLVASGVYLVRLGESVRKVGVVK